jgi:hypothetical protein
MSERLKIRGAVRRLNEVRARVRDPECSRLLDAALERLLQSYPAPVWPRKDPATGRFLRMQR